MLKKLLNLMRPLVVVLYLRMSGELQNKRSPDQQREEIISRFTRRGYPWVIIREYRDDAISGRYLRKRPAYQKLMRDIKTEAIQPDAILVDTAERFGRVDQLQTIRDELREKHGVLILTADTDFTDPNTPGGKALVMVENMRATEHSRILAHNVVRGKKDAARLKRWPGGKAPLGLRLQSVMRWDRDREEVDYSILVVDEPVAPFVKSLFEKAAQTGWAGTRLASFFNSHPDTPEELKPISPSTIMYMLENEIYCGVFAWNQNSTGIVADIRVVEPNPEDEVLRVPDFCEALISRELWDEVSEMRGRRSKPAAQAYAARTLSDKQLKILAPGLTIRYLLSGLIYCAACRRRMRAMSTGTYMTKCGEEKRYAKYMCPGFSSGQCKNSVKVPEEWLRKAVVAKILERLFPGFDAEPEIDGERGVS